MLTAHNSAQERTRAAARLRAAQRPIRWADIPRVWAIAPVVVMLASSVSCSDPATEAASSASPASNVEVGDDPRAMGSSCERFAEYNANWIDGDDTSEDFKVALNFVAVTADREKSAQIERDARAVASRLRRDTHDGSELGPAYQRLLETCAEEVEAL